MLIDQWTRISINMEFDCLETSCRFVYRSLDEAKSKIEQEYSERLNNIKDDEYKHFYEDIMQDDHHNFAEEFPRIQRFSHYLISYGYFEATLNQFCKYAEVRYEHSLKLKDLSGQGIERAKNYLVKVVGVESGLFSSDWQKIKFAGDVRNIIAHTSGSLNYDNDKHKKLADKINKTNGINLTNETEYGSQIVLTDEYVINVIRILRSFINNISMTKISS